MATYKVIQDIEAEDKLVGPFSLRQFIYAGIAAFMGYLCVISVLKGAPFLLAVFLPPLAFCAFFAWPWSPDQPTEVWALARIRFMFKPRRRIWNQTGVRELVTITAPKKIERVYTDGLSQIEVKSRLQALAETIDSRGWAIKNTNLNMTTSPQYANPMPEDDTDRLVNPLSMLQPVPTIDIQAADDILDERNNPLAYKVEQMIGASTQTRHQELLQKLRNSEATSVSSNTVSAPADPNHWFMPQQSTPTPVPAVNPEPATIGIMPVAGTPTADEAAIIEQAKAQNTATTSSYGHLKTIDPQGAHRTEPVPPTVTIPTPPDAAILDLARNNDLNVATLGREARRAKEPPEDEVVIPLR
jgi:hypothetical protein